MNYFRSTLTDSEQFWNDRFDEALDAWRENGILDDNEKPRWFSVTRFDYNGA